MRYLLLTTLGILAFATIAAQAEVSLAPSQLESKSLTQADSPQETQSYTEVQQEKQRESKIPWKAFLLSAALPGLGEHYAGSSVKSKAFMAAEIGLWSAFISFRHLGDWRKDDYKMQAVTAAGADVSGKDDRYFDVLGFYDSREEYNKVAGAYDHSRVYYPDTKSYFWNWESDAAREKYRELKNDSKSYYRNANFSLGLILANHLISAADAYWSVKRYNRRIESGFSGVDLKLLPDGGWQVNLSARF